jgi:hypothetical protein
MPNLVRLFRCQSVDTCGQEQDGGKQFHFFPFSFSRRIYSSIFEEADWPELTATARNFSHVALSNVMVTFTFTILLVARVYVYCQG